MTASPPHRNDRPGTTLDEFKARLPLVEIVGRHVRLQRRGKGDHWGCCPFHKEKSASFHVDEGRGFYHCFGCGAHGNAIDFVMALENLEFGQALERLEELTGIQAPRKAAGADPAPDRSLLAANEAASQWFRQRLSGSDAATARAYLAKRGVTVQAQARFELGWAPGDGEALKSFLTGQGFSEEQLQEAGLLGRSERGTYDWFRSRLIFPIRDGRNRVVGFGGRTLGDAQPKYLNTGETPLFHKGELLYGLPLAQKAARETGTLLVAEGYMDALALIEAGFPAVAPLGTAIGETQIRLLWRQVDEPILCLDGDTAGQRAASRAADRALPLLAAGKSLRIALLPAGDDPDSLIRSRGREAMDEVLAQAMPLVDFVWRRESAGRPLDTPERQAALRQRLIDVARSIQDREIARLYEDAFRERLREALPVRNNARSMRGPFRPGSRGKPGAPIVATGVGSSVLAAAIGRRERAPETAFVEPFLVDPRLLVEAEEEFASIELQDPQLDRIRQEILLWYGGRRDLDASDLRDHLHAAGLSRPLRALWPDGPHDRASGDDVGSTSLLVEWRRAVSAARRRSGRALEAGELEACLRDGADEGAVARVRSLDGLLNTANDEDGTGDGSDGD